MYSCGPPHMANQKQDDQLEHSYSSYVMIRDVTLKTCRRRWMIGRREERGSGISVLAARQDDDDDDDRDTLYNHIYRDILYIVYIVGNIGKNYRTKNRNRNSYVNAFIYLANLKWCNPQLVQYLFFLTLLTIPQLGVG